MLADREYQAIDYQQVGGYRTALSVPMLQGETTIGIFALTRDEVNRFTEKHIELVINFAAQAVIAIENARLLNFRTTCQLAGGLAVAWLKRGARSAGVIPGIGRARHGRYPRSRNRKEGVAMVAVMIGIDPHKASHTAVAIDPAEVPLGQLQVRACAAQAERLLAWAQAWPQRTWAVEGAGGVGHLLAQQLVATGERVLDVPPRLASRVRLLATGNINKNDPSDARSVAVAALRSAGVGEVCRDDHAAVLKVWSKRYKDLGRARTQVACRLHQVLCELIPGGVSKEITAGQAAASWHRSPRPTRLRRPAASSPPS